MPGLLGRTSRSWVCSPSCHGWKVDMQPSLAGSSFSNCVYSRRQTSRAWSSTFVTSRTARTRPNLVDFHPLAEFVNELSIIQVLPSCDRVRVHSTDSTLGVDSVIVLSLFSTMLMLASTARTFFLFYFRYTASRTSAGSS